MEYKNMRMPELKSLARDHRLRNYSQMRKAELVALLQNNGTPEDPRVQVPHTRLLPHLQRGAQHTLLLNLMITGVVGFTAQSAAKPAFLTEMKK